MAADDEDDPVEPFVPEQLDDGRADRRRRAGCPICPFDLGSVERHGGLSPISMRSIRALDDSRPPIAVPAWRSDRPLTGRRRHDRIERASAAWR